MPVSSRPSRSSPSQRRSSACSTRRGDALPFRVRRACWASTASPDERSGPVALACAIAGVVVAGVALPSVGVNEGRRAAEVLDQLAARGVLAGALGLAALGFAGKAFVGEGAGLASRVLGAVALVVVAWAGATMWSYAGRLAAIAQWHVDRDQLGPPVFVMPAGWDPQPSEGVMWRSYIDRRTGAFAMLMRDPAPSIDVDECRGAARALFDEVVAARGLRVQGDAWWVGATCTRTAKARAPAGTELVVEAGAVPCPVTGGSVVFFHARALSAFADDVVPAERVGCLRDAPVAAR